MLDAAVTFADIEDDSPEDKTLVSASDCEKLGVTAQTVWQWASRGLVIDGERRKLQRRALNSDGSRPLYFRADVITFRDSRRVALAEKVSGGQDFRRAKCAQKQPDHLTVVGLSHVPGQGGGDVAEEAPNEIVIPVRLDFTKARQDLANFLHELGSSVAQKTPEQPERSSAAR